MEVFLGRALVQSHCGSILISWPDTLIARCVGHDRNGCVGVLLLVQATHTVFINYHSNDASDFNSLTITRSIRGSGLRNLLRVD